MMLKSKPASRAAPSAPHTVRSLFTTDVGGADETVGAAEVVVGAGALAPPPVTCATTLNFTFAGGKHDLSSHICKRTEPASASGPEGAALVIVTGTFTAILPV